MTKEKRKREGLQLGNISENMHRIEQIKQSLCKGRIKLIFGKSAFPSLFPLFKR